MRKAWRATSAAALFAVATIAGGADAGPADMAMRPAAQPAQGPSDPSQSSWQLWRPMKPAPKVVRPPQAPLPSAQVSPLKHPIQYFSAAMSETPIAAAMRHDQPAGAVVRPKPEPHDRIALNTPAGPASPQLYISMAQMSERQGRIPEARQHLQHALKLWPNDVEVLRAAARMEDRQGGLALAESLYARAVKANPQHAGALNDLGLCLARQGKLDQSAQVIEQAIQLQPDKALYRNNAAKVLVELQQDQRALAHLSAVHGPAASNYNMGQLLMERGRTQEAVKYFQTAVQLDPTMQPAQTAIAQATGKPTTQQSQVTTDVAITPQQPTEPGFGPEITPQAPVPQPEFPATARGPAFGNSSYMPPRGYYPAAGYNPAGGVVPPVSPVYQTATRPRYLPPVPPMAPGTMVR